MKIGFQGIKGAYSEAAALAYFSSKRIKTVAFPDFRAVFEAVSSGELRYGMIPIENSLAGSIYENYDHCYNHEVWITAEYRFRVQHSLLALPGSTSRRIKTVYSHPQALGQCSQFLKTRKINVVPFFDTAGAAKFVAEQKDPSIAAIASRYAADQYQLEVIKSSLEDHKKNTTRFFLIEKFKPKAKSSKTNGPAKTSIVFSLKNTPGCLHKCLSIFAIRDIDLTKIQSRPLRGSSFKYLFYVDIAGDYFDEPVYKAIQHLREVTAMVKVLGTYEEGKSP